MRSNVPDDRSASVRPRLKPSLANWRIADAQLVLRACPTGNNWSACSAATAMRRPDYALLKQGRDSGRCSRQHGADIAKPQRRGCVDSPDLAITNGDPADRMSDLRNRIGHALHLFGEPVPLGENSLVLRPHTAICFERLQGLDPFGSFVPARASDPARRSRPPFRDAQPSHRRGRAATAAGSISRSATAGGSHLGYSATRSAAGSAKWASAPPPSSRSSRPGEA